MKDSIQEANKILSKIDKRKKQSWMTDDILNLMDERKDVKMKDPDRYKNLSKRIKSECIKAKVDCIDQQCSIIEKLNSENKSKNLHKEVKVLIGEQFQVVEE